jgi:hypothetical protein
MGVTEGRVSLRRTQFLKVVKSKNFTPKTQSARIKNEVRKLIKFFKSFIEHLKVTKKTALKDKKFFMTAHKIQ